MKKLMFAAVAACAIPVVAKTLAEVPVAEVANKAYLSDMEDRLWWNKAWKKRTAILVSNTSKVRADKVAVDFVLDVGEKIDPVSVRVVTPWEREVPSEAESARNASDTAVRIVFLTDLREMENRPFFVYWGNPGAQPTKARSGLTLFASDDEVYVNNGAVEVVFDNLHRTDGLIKTLKANGSQAPSFLWRTTGFAWEGFTFETDGKKARSKLDPAKVRPGNALDSQIHKPDAEGGWSKAIVTADRALRKTITFTNEFASLDFTFYAGVPRVDFAYRLAPGLTRANIGVSWAAGGGTAHDDFYYPGIAGKVLTQRAALDWVTDCEPAPMEFYRFPWFGKGWYAFADHRTRDVVGMVFDRDALDGVAYLAGATHCGEAARLGFRHKPSKGECARGGGALVTTVGDYRDVEREHELLKSRPRVFVGAVQPYREILPKRRDLVHDFCVNCNVGGWKSGKPLPGDEWIVNILDHLRERGANTILLGQLTDYDWTDLPVPKDLYDRTCARAHRDDPKWKAPEWGNGNFTGERLRAVCAAAHARGMAVQTWHDAIPGVYCIKWKDRFDPELQALCREFQALYPKCGVDSTFNALGGGEGTPLPKEVLEKYGRSFWKWDDPQPFFDSRRVTAGFMKAFYDYAHKVNPGTCVMVFNSDNGELGREMCMPYYPGCMDTLYCEICPGDGDYDKIKHTVKRLRSYFDNEDGRTICAHYYCMKLDHANRITENEMPFICGVNAFSQESMTYENVDPENFQFSADFSRFAGYTRLGEKAAKMGPVKNLAVFRDMDCFEEDARKHRTVRGGWGYDMSRHDARVNGFARIRNYNYDIVMNPFFKVESLKRYNVVYIPDDEVLSEANAKELLAFIEQGGGAVVEGSAGERVKAQAEQWNSKFDCGEVVEHGKGKIVWTKDILTERLQKRDLSVGEKVKSLVAAVGGHDPLTIESKTLDGVLQASKEGMMLGVYNRGKDFDSGRVEIKGLGQRSRSAKEGEVFVLDVKRGERFPYTNGFEIVVGPRQCGFYLIGDDAFTAVPATTEAAWTGPSAASAFANGTKPNPEGGKPFEARHCVEFVTPAPRNFAGQPARIERSERAMLVRHRFCAAEDRMVERAKADDFEAWMEENALGAKCYKKSMFANALKAASYVHFQCDGKDCDEAFEDCAEELKALLKRGGGILFMRTRPGPKARKFLADIGVFDPSPSIKDGFEERAMWSPSVSTNHPLIKAKGSWYNSNVGGSRKYTTWDKDRQYAPYVDKLRPENALMVIQDDVLGAGKVMFSLNKYCFTSWYENYDHGDGVLSYLLGMPVKEHAEKVQLFNGGPGSVVR